MRRFGGALEWGLLAVAFALSRWLWDLTKLRFRADTMDYFAQMLDPPLLQERLLESLWYLHAQPPLLNLLAGVALKASPERPDLFLGAVFWLAGLAICLALYAIGKGLGLPRPAAGLLALAIVSTPTTLVYEHWFFYPHLAAALLTGAAALFLASRGRPGPAWAGGFWLLAVLVWLRSLFHPVFFFALVGVAVLTAAKSDRGRALRGAALPAAFVLLLVLKNLFVFGFAGTSSWGGNSLHRMMTEVLPRETLEAAVAAEEITPLSLEWEFSKPEKYLEVLGIPDEPRGVPALDEKGKTRARTNAVNYNHWTYLEVGPIYTDSAVHLIRAHPGMYAKSVQWTARRYLDPVTDDMLIKPIRFRVKRFIEPFEAAQQSPFLRGLAILAVLYLGFRAGRGLFAAERHPDGWFAFFVFAVIVWVSTLGILFEYGENNRFRYQIGPLVWIAVGVAGRDLWRRFRPASGGSADAGEAAG